MSEEPKKISFGFTKVSKKTNLIQTKKETEVKSDIQFIDCLEEKSIKLVGGNEKEKELPIIPMLNGNLLKESIREVVKLREQNKNGQDGQGDVTTKEDCDPAQKPLTLDELATKEILEDLKKGDDNKKEEHDHVVPLTTKVTIQDKESNLEDYESMPIADFGLAMLRGMGWDPKKGIGLNGKIVTPLPTSLRPKGMGLGADKVPTTKNVTSNGELLIMKKGAPVKVVSGPHNNLYGKIEGFDELPGRLLVRIAESSVIVSLNEIMVQLVSSSEYNKNVGIENVQPLKTERHNLPQNSQVIEKSMVKITQLSNSTSLYEVENSKLNRSNSKDEEVNGKVQIETKKARKDVRTDEKVKSMLSDSDDVEDKKYVKKRKTEEKRSKSSSSCESGSDYKSVRRTQKKHSESRYRGHHKESKYSKKSYNYTSSEINRRIKKSSRRHKYGGSSSSDYDKKDSRDAVRRSRKGRRSKSSDSSSSSGSYRKSHIRKHKKHYKR